MMTLMDKEHFIQILKDNKGIIYKVINTYCKESDEKKDLEQEIVIQLWKSFKSYNSDYKISTWIYKIAMNISISYYRSNLNRKSKTISINESIFQEIESENNSDELEDNRRLLHEFMNQLNEFDKQILILYFDDLSYKEIADIVGITETHVGTKINRIKKKIQEDFSKLKQF
jgi:RNA polymerase sigma factor (sigma-70 family)